jgi:hypothetical protein
MIPVDNQADTKAEKIRFRKHRYEQSGISPQYKAGVLKTLLEDFGVSKPEPTSVNATIVRAMIVTHYVRGDGARKCAAALAKLLTGRP